jgi:hypothetical protein
VQPVREVHERSQVSGPAHGSDLNRHGAPSYQGLRNRADFV